MFKFLHSIFGGDEQHGRYPASLIDMAIERALEGTDPRLRALPGYARKLREPIIHAIDHVIDLVEDIHKTQPRVRVDTATHGADPRLGALFATSQSMFDTLARDQTLRDYLEGAPERRSHDITTLLLCERLERHVLGMEVVDDQLRKDVAQVAVSFLAHRLLEPDIREEESRRHLKRRGFDFILTQALNQINERTLERADLNRQRDLLTRKLEALERGGWSFKLMDPQQPDLASLSAELDGITEQLQALGPDQAVLESHLAIVIEALDNAERYLRIEPLRYHLDAMNILRDPQDPSARDIDLLELRGARDQAAVILPLLVIPDLLPAQPDFLTAIERYY